MYITPVVLSSERVIALLPALKAGAQEGINELMMGYIRLVRVWLKGQNDDVVAVGMATMVACIRKLEGVDKEHESLTNYIRKTISGAVKEYLSKDHLVPIARKYYKGERFRLPPAPSIERASVQHYHKKLLYMQLKEAMSGLPRLEYRILILRSENNTLVEIAGLLDMPKSQVHVVEQRAILMMRKLMGES